MTQQKTLVGYEPIFAVHCPNDIDPANDLHVVKVNAHYSDGTSEPKLLHKYGFKRPYYITKPKYRNHREKKTYEHIEKLDRFECTQSELIHHVGRRLQRHGKLSLRQLGDSPYLYGTDILSTAVLVHQLRRKYKAANETPSRRSLAVLDIEWSLKEPHEPMTLLCLSMKNKALVAVNKSLVAGYHNQVERLREAMNEYIGDLLKERNIDVDKIDIRLCNDEAEMLYAFAECAHAWRPDFIGTWSITAELDKFIDIADRYQLDLGDILSDPSVPKEYRKFKFKKGRLTHVSKAMRTTTLRLEKQWHTVFVPASFYFICMMGTYTFVRQGQQALKASLEATLNRHLKLGKLKLPDASAYTGAEWHLYMEKHHPFAYAAYCLVDCIRPEQLDETTGDVGVSLPTLAGISDFSVFNSNPKTLVDELTVTLVSSHKVVMASTPDKRYDPFKGRTIDQRCIIVTLDTSLRTREGWACVKELPNYKTNVYAYTIDCDLTTAYPGIQCQTNMCGETTHREILCIHGVTEQSRREQGINLAASAQNNAVEISQAWFGASSMLDVLATFKREHEMV